MLLIMICIAYVYNFGCIKVNYKNVAMDLQAAIKMIKKQKGMFQFVILSFIGAIDMDRKIAYFESFGDFSIED